MSKLRESGNDTRGTLVVDARGMTTVDLNGQRFEVTHVFDPSVAMVSLGSAIQGCAEILRGKLVGKPSADGSASVSARTIAEVAALSGFGFGVPLA